MDAGPKGKRAATKKVNKGSEEDGEWTQVGSAPNNLKLVTPPTKKETETVQPPNSKLQAPAE
jgi:hypothetical protein